MSRITWFSIEARIAEAVEQWSACEESGAALNPEVEVQTLRDNARRHVVVLKAPCCQPLLIKHFRSVTGKHALRERVKRLIGYAPATREFNNLKYLAEHGVWVPTPLGIGALPNGELLLVLPFFEGTTLDQLERGVKWRRTLQDVGGLVRSMHEAGMVHRDLHASNILVTERGPILLDLQRARKTRSRRARLADLGWLDSSLARFASLADRLRLREAMLGFSRPWKVEARVQISVVGDASLARLSDYARGRTRRCLLPGRRYARIENPAGRGLRLRRVDAQTVNEIVAGHRAALAAGDGRVLKNEARSRVTRISAQGRRYVVKERIETGVARRLANLLRGSAARRGWVGGHGLLYRGIGAPEPQAYLEMRRLGLPISSLLVMEDIGSAQAVQDLPKDEIEESEVLRALAKLMVRLHERNVDHGDMKAGNIFLRHTTSGWQTFLIDFEGVRFRRRLSEARRILALAQLNASLWDFYPARERCIYFKHYTRRLSFRDEGYALQEIVKQSLARGHHWSGRDCELAGIATVLNSASSSPEKR